METLGARQTIVLRTALALLLPLCLACGGTSAGRIAIPSLSGEERVPLSWQPGPGALAERASAERTRQNLGAAERFARWALSLEPEHPGALVEAARAAAARAALAPEPSLRALELEAARRLYELAEIALTNPAAISSGAAQGREPREPREPRELRELAEERDRVHLALAEAELSLGRIEQASALLTPLDARGHVPRARRLALHEALADATIALGAHLEAGVHQEAARRLGASLGKTRLRDAALSLLSATSEELLLENRRRIELSFGQSADLFGELALAIMAAPSLVPTGGLGHAEWAASRAATLVPSPANLTAWVEAIARGRGPASGAAKARELLASAGPLLGELCLRFVEAMRPFAPREAAALAEEGAQNPAVSTADALALALWALDTLPAPERAPAFSRLFGNNATSPRPFAGLEAAPTHWAAVTRHALASGDRSSARRAAELAAPSSPPAALTALELALEAGADDASIQALLVRLASASRAATHLEPPSGLTLTREDPRMSALIALELLAARGRLGLWAPEKDGAEFGANATTLVELWRLSAAGKLEAAAQKAAPLAAQRSPLAALAYARWLSQGARSHEAAAAWLSAVELAPAALELSTLGLAVESLWPLVIADRLDRGPFESVLSRWLAALPDAAATRRATMALLGELATSTRLASTTRLALLTRLHRAGSSVGLDVRTQLVLQQPLDTPDLDEQHENTSLARLTLSLPAPSVERLAEEALRQQRTELAVRLYSRIPASVLERPDSAIDLVKLMAGRGEPERARRYARAVLARGEPSKSIPSGRMTALGDAMADLSEWALARDCYDRARALGDRSSRPILGAIRASLRLSDEAQADRLANQWLSSSPTRDARIYDELAQLYAAEGRHGRALELTRARVLGDRLDANVFVAVADLLKRTGQLDALAAEAQAFAESDARGTHRGHLLGAQKLMEVGRPTEALALLERGLAARNRDSSLLSAALTAALAARDPKAETLARRLLTEAPATWDLWARVLEDVRAAGQPEVAQRLADFGLQRSPGQARLLISRGKILLSLGAGDAALSDFAEGLARADDPRQAMAQVDEALQRGWQDERLAAITARALALTPGRADLTLAHADALIAAGRDAEAQRLLARFLSESDRGHTAIASTWFRRGFLDRALDHWTRGFEQLDDREAVDAMAMLAPSLASLGQGDRADIFERLYIQTQRGTKSPTLMPLGQLHTMLGDRASALRWLERADLENPTADTARALFEHHLAGLTAEHKTNHALLVHGERVIARSSAAAAPGRGPQQTLHILQLLADQLIERGRPDLAAALAQKASRRFAGLGPRLIAARALVRDGRLGDALDQLSEPFPAWRNARDSLPLLGRLVEDLVALGHTEAAHGLLSRSDPNDKERELRLARLRVAVRAGRPERALLFARQLAAEQPSLNQWLMAEVLSAERMPRTAAPFAKDALASSLTGNVRDRATRVLAVVSGLEPALDASPRLNGDRWERAGVKARVGASLAVPTSRLASHSAGRAAAGDALASPAWGVSLEEALTRAHGAALESLRVGPLEPQSTWSALATAGLLDASSESTRGGRVSATLAAMGGHGAPQAKQLEEAGRALMSLGLAGPARRVLSAARELHPGHLPLALETARATLQAGEVRELESVLTRGFSGVESAPLIARLEVLALAAAHGEGTAALAILHKMVEELEAAGQRQHLALDALGARVRALALVEAETALWDEAARSALAAAPEESVARVELARYALATTSPSSKTTQRAANLLEPLLTGGRASQRALELALAAAMRARELARAKSLLAELNARFPGPPLEPTLLLEAALVSGHGPLLDATLRDTPPAAVHEVIDALARGPSTGSRLSNELAQALDTWLLGAQSGLGTLELRPGDTRPGPFEARVALHLALGDPKEAVALAASAHALAPSSERAALLYAATLARANTAHTSVPLEPREAFRLIESLGAGLRGSLMETEARLLAPSANPRLHLALAELHLAMGENAQSLMAWRRFRAEMTARPVTTPPLRAPSDRPPWVPGPDPFVATPEAAAHLSIGLALAERGALTGEALRGFLAGCVAAQRAPWSGLCRARMSRL